MKRINLLLYLVKYHVILLNKINCIQKTNISELRLTKSRPLKIETAELVFFKSLTVQF